MEIRNTISEVASIVQDVFKEIELQEPRFISTFVDVAGYYEGKYTHFSNTCLDRHMSFLHLVLHLVRVVSLSYYNLSNNIKKTNQLIINGHIFVIFIGLSVVSSNEFEVILYLNQMGVFSFVDDGSIPGCAVLKLSDGRKRSMSLWVEFITASGYLSARKIRSRFLTLVSKIQVWYSSQV